MLFIIFLILGSCIYFLIKNTLFKKAYFFIAMNIGDVYKNINVTVER